MEDRATKYGWLLVGGGIVLLATLMTMDPGGALGVPLAQIWQQLTVGLLAGLSLIVLSLLSIIVGLLGIIFRT